MNKEQSARLHAHERGYNFLVKNDDELMTDPLYLPLKNDYKNLLNKIRAASQKQFVQIKPVTKKKKRKRSILIKTVSKCSAEAAVQAYIAKNPGLAIALDKPMYYFTLASDHNLIGRTTDLKKIMADNISTLTCITPADILAMETLILDYSNVSQLPEIEIKKKKAEGTDPIPGFLNDIDVVKRFTGKLLASSFPHLYPTWAAETKSGSHGGRHHTSLIITYKNSSSATPVRKVKTTISFGKITRRKVSTVRGYVRFFSLPSGSYNITSECKGYKKIVRRNVGIYLDKTARITVMLQPDIRSGTLDLTVYEQGTNAPLPDVTFSIPSLQIICISDQHGKIIKKDIPPASYQGILSLPGYKTIEFNITIEARQTAFLQFFLEK
jgi:hypothetical protein